MITMSNKRSRSRRKYDFEVNSCLHLLNVAQAPLIRCLISVVSCCWNIIIWPNCFVLSSLVNTSTLMLSISNSFVLFELRLIRIFVFSWMYLESHFFCAMFGVTHHFLKLLFCSCKQEHFVSKSQICEAV